MRPHPKKKKAATYRTNHHQADSDSNSESNSCYYSCSCSWSRHVSSSLATLFLLSSWLYCLLWQFLSADQANVNGTLMDVPLLRQKRLCPLQRQLKPPPGDGDSWQLYAVDVMVKCPLPLFVSAFFFAFYLWFLCGWSACKMDWEWMDEGVSWIRDAVLGAVNG